MTNAQKQKYFRTRRNAKMKRYEHALQEIMVRSEIEIGFDPAWASKTANAALNPDNAA